jgi:hypothetical protein
MCTAQLSNSPRFSLGRRVTGLIGGPISATLRRAVGVLQPLTKIIFIAAIAGDHHLLGQHGRECGGYRAIKSFRVSPSTEIQ